jgi:hypothetical protein
MNFDDYANQAIGLHLTFLESGSQDETALNSSITAAYQAIESLPPGRLTPSQERQWALLAGIYQELKDKTWYPEDRQVWLEEVLYLLQELRS